MNVVAVIQRTRRVHVRVGIPGPKGDPGIPGEQGAPGEGGGMAPREACIVHRQPAGVDGGGTSGGAWHDLPLNHFKFDDISTLDAPILLVAGGVELPPGRYRAEAWTPFYGVGAPFICSLRLQHDNGGVLGEGPSEFDYHGSNTRARHLHPITFTIGPARGIVYLQYKMMGFNGVAGYGRGIANAVQVGMAYETYTVFRLVKLE